jgi:asparagine synthase (glutamine-hydrolysing)
VPGIFGFITKVPREQAEPQLLEMLASVCHEPSYETGTWIDESLGVYIGWTALKDSFAGGMPLWNEKKDAVLVFSGEEFAEPDTVRRLRELGHALELKAASYLIHLYEEDPAFPAGLNGRFHGLLADRTRGTTTLFNDRYGMHRVYYHEAKDAFYFAAEAKAILKVRPELRKADLRGLGELVSCGCVLENRTVFQGIHVLEGAAAWTFRHGSLEKKKYFSAREWEEQDSFDPQVYSDELQQVFSRNLPRYFQARQRVGISLTGGLDTRIIMAWDRSPPGSVPCYSFGSMYRDSEDVRIARRVANARGHSHEVIQVGHEFLTKFAEYAERTVYLTDACADVSRSPDLYANRQAAGIAPIRMTGNYGGEVLRRVRAFKPVEPGSGLFRTEFLSHVQVAKETYNQIANHGHPLSFAVFRQAPWHHYGLLALEQTQLSVRSPYLDNDFVRTAFRAPQAVLVNDDVCLKLITAGDLRLRRIRTDRRLTGNQPHLRAAILARYLTFTFKSEYAYDYGMPQWLAGIDHLLFPLHLERLFLGRHKFCHFRIWYRDALANYVRELLLDRRTLSRPFVQRKGLEAIVERHLKGDRNYTTQLHKVLTIELLHRLFLDAQ